MFLDIAIEILSEKEFVECVNYSEYFNCYFPKYSYNDASV